DALADQPLTDAMQRLQVELIGGLGDHELHRRSLYCLGNRLSVTEVVLLAFGIGSHVPRRHQPRIVPQRVELATEMMRTDAGLHADQARGHIGKACFHLTTRPLLPQHDCATTIEPNDVERVLTDINADYGNRTLCCRSHGVLLVLAPLASLSLAGQEHGRTIPLADTDHATYLRLRLELSLGK